MSPDRAIRGGSAFSGAVLTGGGSRRMGRDKALIEVGGRAMAARVADALRTAGARPVHCVGGDADGLAALGLDPVPDLHPGEGPVGGVVTALDGEGPAVVVVLGCDLVAPDPGAISALAAAAAGADVAVPLVGGHRQWHHSAWRRGAGSQLADAFAAGARSFTDAVAGLRVVDQRGVSERAVADADRPDDLR